MDSGAILLATIAFTATTNGIAMAAPAIIWGAIGISRSSIVIAIPATIRLGKVIALNAV